MFYVKSQNMVKTKNGVYCRVIIFRQLYDNFNNDDMFDCFFKKNELVMYNAVFFLKITKSKTIISAQKVDCSDLSVQKVFYEQKTPKKVYDKLKNENMPLFATTTITLSDTKIIKELLNLD